jgi:U3 small nucleolar ribonucleoprotein protein LCP5
MPASMDDEDRRHKQASRKDRALARMATENPYIKDIIDDAADRPEEVCLFCFGIILMIT